VQPANVIVDADGAHCLVDFGLAWRWPFAVPRRVPGTAWFQAPEAVLAGGRLEPATDVYALAVTTYLLLAGRLPFVETDCEATVLRMQVEVPPLPLRVVAPRVSAPVARVVMAGLDKDVDRRIGSAGAFARALVDAADSSHPSTWGGSP
jgi:serine/threonine protein kinase